MKKRKTMNKLGVSEIISYVLLVTIAIGISIAVYAWMKSYAVNPTNIDCKEGTSMSLEEYICTPDGIILLLKNNGRFNVSGVVVTVSNDTNREPEYYLKLKTAGFGVTLEGYYFFIVPLSPGTEDSVVFSKTETKNNIPLTKLENINIQPFTIITVNGKKNRILCKEGIIKQKLENCNLS
ncbi:MAG: hypothetical protein AABX54_00105 [Nanoarchaeota archaeon]